MPMDSPQIISVKQARKLLGKPSAILSDAQVKDMIEQLDFLASLTIREMTRKPPDRN